MTPTPPEPPQAFDNMMRYEGQKPGPCYFCGQAFNPAGDDLAAHAETWTQLTVAQNPRPDQQVGDTVWACPYCYEAMTGDMDAPA